MAFSDKEHGLRTGASIVQRSSHNLVLAVYGTNGGFVIVLQDIMQAYS